MVYRDHIGITSGNKSTTHACFSVAECPGCSTVDVTHSDSSDTFRRVGRRFGNTAPYVAYMHSSGAFLPTENATSDAVSPLDTDGNLPWSNRDKSTYLTLFPTIVRSSPPVNRQRPAINAVREYAVTADRRSHQGRGPGTVIPVRKLVCAESPEGGSTAILCVSQPSCMTSPDGGYDGRQWVHGQPAT